MLTQECVSYITEVEDILTVCIPLKFTDLVLIVSLSHFLMFYYFLSFFFFFFFNFSILMLAEGRIAFMGSTENAIDYFKWYSVNRVLIC